MAGTAVDTPPFYCPIESAIHPQAAEAEQRALAWADRSGLCRTDAERARFVGTRSADFYARFAPHADLERLWVAACWVYWGFAFDDARCDEGPFATDPAAFAAMAFTVQRALEVPGLPHPTDPYADALHEIGELFRACAGPVQNRRFHHAHRAWLTGVQWQIGNRATGHMPDLDEYLAMRLHSAGGEPTYAMLEIANGLDVPEREMDSPAVCALTEMAILVAALDNDRHSHAKEACRRQTGQNIFSVLMAHHGYSLSQAVDEAIALRDAVLVRFLGLRDLITPRASAPLRHYLADLGHGIRGNIEWGLHVPRYLTRTDPAPRLRIPAQTAPGHWTDLPRTGEQDPRRLPSIAWWWKDPAF
ncbi:glutamate dehydrogenase [Streptomyces sp. ISL-22]|uniref:terpene synthase family protein n=1 Tax=unclassified Streptomyces TaxID=2593676 RepID=UPI001BE92645|nr:MULTISPECIES: glutamate dehydrogenase [unclassified Streptomyces]MBT2422740.1 glutamate dehydrogenase [Streptomyces sp. ISL-24]MBT2435897.1 glutamate dehydrogenase [Streptomyces sp. ISL-22]